jgi:hypothetical protein
LVRETLSRSAAEASVIDLLQRWGFEETAASIRMTRGVPSCAGVPERIYGITNGAMG